VLDPRSGPVGGPLGLIESHQKNDAGCTIHPKAQLSKGCEAGAAISMCL
jgi:hypothetical protein